MVLDSACWTTLWTTLLGRIRPLTPFVEQPHLVLEALDFHLLSPPFHLCPLPVDQRSFLAHPSLSSPQRHHVKAPGPLSFFFEDCGRFT